MSNQGKIIVGGILLALLTIRCFYWFYSPIAYEMFALFLGYTACVYLGAALADSRIQWISVEFGMSLLFFTIAAMGLLVSPMWIGIGFALHGIWDMLHHPKVIKTKVIHWFPPLCAIFDVTVAAYIFIFF
ncbi:DUF6010 family protein [Paenibacillus silviterrae]|uniref:DUF6010 family protein n=1 Tax=Paenibacillus silviterrae TaxID=3242194 RepID=UPI0025439BE7|nr:DUF6010 family protein [Paenibacillus chinjuensis]